MSSRQQRLDPDTLRKSTDFTGRKISVVLKDKTVMLGRVKNVDTSFLELINMRLKNLKIPLDNIYEVYYDTKE